MKAYMVTIIGGEGRVVRHVIAASSVKAIGIAANTIPAQPASFAIICKPSEKLQTC